MPPSWIVTGCLNGRGLVQRRVRVGGWIYSFPHSPLAHFFHLLFPALQSNLKQADLLVFMANCPHLKYFINPINHWLNATSKINAKKKDHGRVAFFVVKWTYLKNFVTLFNFLKLFLIRILTNVVKVSKKAKQSLYFLSPFIWVSHLIYNTYIT